MTNTKAPRDFNAEYFEASIEWRRPGATLADRSKADRKLARIASAAYRAGADFDEIEIDERARVSLYGAGQGA